VRTKVMIIVMLAAVLSVQTAILWVQSNIRSDQLTIRHWIAHELRARRGER
jgi:cell division protein FtsL